MNPAATELRKLRIEWLRNRAVLIRKWLDADGVARPPLDVHDAELLEQAADDIEGLAAELSTTRAMLAASAQAERAPVTAQEEAADGDDDKPMCEANDGSYFCTRIAGHAGDHAAYGSTRGRGPYHRWPQDVAAPEERT